VRRIRENGETDKEGHNWSLESIGMHGFGVGIWVCIVWSLSIIGSNESFQEFVLSLHMNLNSCEIYTSVT
jgi:hypothetical protein